MAGCPTDQALEAFRAGEAGAELAAQILEHVQSCARCREILAATPRGDDTTTRGAAAAGALLTSFPSLELDPLERARLLPPQIPGYEFVRELGRGGQALVFEAIQHPTERKVAVKVLLDGHYASAQALARFDQEIKIIAQFRHPNIITIFGAGTTQDGRPFYAMDYVRGAPLHQWVRTNRPAPPDVLRLFTQICDALHYAHERGIVHRDLKPGNILIDEHGVPKIVDFGLAKRLAAPSNVDLSTSGAILGTIPYLAPEQTRTGAVIDRRTDVYALGVILYEQLVGRRPYPTEGAITEVLHNICEAPPQPPAAAWREIHVGKERSRTSSQSESKSRVTSRTGARSVPKCPITRDLEAILLAALAKEPERRYATAGALGADICRYLAGEPIERFRESWWYVFRRHAAKMIARQTLLASLVVFVFSALIAQGCGVMIVYYLSPLHSWYISMHQPVSLASALPASSAGGGPALGAGIEAPRFNHVRIIAINNNDSLKQAAADAGITALSRTDRKPLRAVHGAMLERLARSGARVIGVDIMFIDPHPADERLVEGIRALRAAGTEVVLAVRYWELDPLAKPQLTPALVKEARRGCVEAHLQAEIPWQVALAVQRLPYAPRLSFATAIAGAFLHPDAELEVTINLDRFEFTGKFSRLEPASRQRRYLESGDIRLKLTGANRETGSADAGVTDIQADDIEGRLVFRLRDRAQYADVTYDYAHVYAASPDQLRAWFKDKAVLIADLRREPETNAPDWAESEDGPRPKVYVHADALETLLESATNPAGVTIPRGALFNPRSHQQYGWILVGVLVGTVLGRRWCDRGAVRAGGLLVAGAALTVAGLTALRSFQAILNPAFPILGAFLASELSAWVGRVAARQRNASLSFRSNR